MNKPTTRIVVAGAIATMLFAAVRAELIVYEGFSATDYGIKEDADATTLNSMTVVGADNVGFTAQTSWSGMGGSQIKVYGSLLGLDYPQCMKDEGFTAVGGSCGTNPDASNGEMRAMNHTLAANTLKLSEGTLAMSMLVNADATALGKLSAKTDLSGGSYYGFGVCQSPSGNAYQLLTNQKSALAFCIRKRTADSKFWVALSVVDAANALHSYDLCEYEVGQTYLCYAEVTFDGADGAERIRAGAMKTSEYDGLDVQWADLGEGTPYVEHDVISETAFPTCMAVAGPYGSGSKGYFRADELRIGTELTDVIVITTNEPKLTAEGGRTLWNAVSEAFEVSGTMLRNDATLQASARLSEDDPSPVVSSVSDLVEEGETGHVAFGELTPNRTYGVELTATNAFGTDVKSAGALYSGELTLTLLSDANEFELEPGRVRVSRASADPYALEVAYSFASTAEGAEEGKTWEAPEGVVTIPAGEASAEVQLKPLVDVEVVSDILVRMTLGAGGYRNVGAGLEIPLHNVSYNTWAPGEGSDALASNPANWSFGRAPVETDAILLDGPVGNLTWDAAAVHAVRSWTQTAAYDGTVTVETVFPGKGDFTCLSVSGSCVIDGGVMTHPQSRTMGDNHGTDWDWLADLKENETYRLRLDCASLTVGKAGRIDVSLKGYYASHDGSRVHAAHGSLSHAGGEVYGNPKEPVHIGMPHRVAGNYYNGKGGGAVYITVNGAAVVDGIVSADSGNSGYGAGAAGSVYLQAGSVSGTGQITAYGSATGEGNYKGTGGRVAIITDTPVDRSTFARISAAAEWKNAQSNPASECGGPGTVYFRDSTMTQGLLVVEAKSDVHAFHAPEYFRNASVGREGDWSFDAVELGANSFLLIPEGLTLTLPNGLDSVRSTAADANSPGGIMSLGGSLDLGAAERQVMKGFWMLTGVGELEVDCSLTVREGARLGVPHLHAAVYDGSAGALAFIPTCSIHVKGDLTVAADGMIDARHCGYRKQNQWVEQGLLGHAAHGGRLNEAKDKGLTTYGAYDSVFAPHLPGCSMPWPNGQTAGFAGGAVRLVVDGALALNGPANANGEPEAYNQNGNAGGGAGGSIDITAASISGSGSISANGGSYSWMSGSGGRVAVKLTGAGADFSDFSGVISASGRKEGGQNRGSAGTIYLRKGSEGAKAGVVKIEMASGWGLASSSNTTEFVSLGYDGDEVTDLKRVRFEIANHARGAVNANLKIAGLTLADDTAAVDFEGHDLTAKSVVVNGGKLAPGTYTIPARTESGVGVHPVYGAFYNSGDRDSVLTIGGSGLFLMVR